MTILVTGGAGHIGSHTVLCLLQASRDLAQMLADTWRWQQMNPEGFNG